MRNALVVLTGVILMCLLVVPTAHAAAVTAEIKNAAEGVYWRSVPKWDAAIKKAGHGVYDGDVVELICHVKGEAVPDSPINKLWYRAKIVSGKGVGTGLVNDHYLDTPVDQPNIAQEGVPSCRSGGASEGDVNEDVDSESDAPKVQKADARDPCVRQYPNIKQWTDKKLIGSVQRFDRTASLYHVCQGFGSEKEKEFTTAMKCAMTGVVAAVTDDASTKSIADVCQAVGVVEDLAEGDWAGLSCGFWATIIPEVTAGKVKRVSVANKIGERAERAFKASLGFACGGIFDEGASTFGQNLETRHQGHIAGEVVNNGRCMEMRETPAGIAWESVNCR